MELLTTARVTVDEVREVVTDNAASDGAIGTCINTAHRLIQGYQDILDEHNADELRIMELWLSCHYLAAMTPQITSESMEGELIVKYHMPDMGPGLQGTWYGQQAIAMDRTRTLATTTARGRATFQVN